MNAEQERRLREAAGEHELLLHGAASAASVAPGESGLAHADVAFGQPPLGDVLDSPRLRWVQLSSAGYTSYDTAAARRAFAKRGAVLTKSSHVYASPCAEHVLAFMLSWARRLPLAWREQEQSRGWPQGEVRRRSVLLSGQHVAIVGFGSIALRLVELLAPFTRNVVGVRREVHGDEGIAMLHFDAPELAAALGRADHVVNVLPAAEETTRFFDRARLAQVKPGAVFYNVGRGTTVDQEALLDCLSSRHLQAALLDVTDPEPLPPDHPLWAAPNCFITPHSAGGHHDEGDRLIAHFIDNLRRFERGEALLDRAY